MDKNKKQVIFPILFVLALFSLIVAFMFVPFAKVSAESIVDIEGTNANGAIVLDENNKYLKTKSFEVQNDTGYVVGDASESYVLSKDGKGTTFASLFVETLGEGGEVLRGSEKYNGFDAYGYVAGSGEEIYKVDENNNLVLDEKGEKIIVGYKSVALKLKYNFDSNDDILGVDGRKWNISEDTWQKGINGLSSVGVVGKGAVIVQKFVPSDSKAYPTTSSDWTRLNQFSNKETDGIHTVNFFNEFNPSNNKTPFNLYTPKGEDLKNGVYIKVTIAYELVNYEKKFLITRKTYKNIVEETTFYLCNTSGEVVFENMYYSSSNNEETTRDEQTTTTLEQKGGVIANKQGSVDGFRIDMRGNNFDIKYRFNNSKNYVKCNDGEVFLNPGRYDFKITTKLGLVRTKTIFIHEQGSENNAKIYFGNSLFSDDSQRVFSTSDSYPVFVKGYVKLKTNLFSKNIYAPLVGKVFRLDGDWEEVERDDKNLPKTKLVSTKQASDDTWEFSDLEEGNYEAIFANNEDYFDGETSGDTYKFVWRFSVVEEGQTPIINQSTLENANGVSDYDSMQYAVVLKSKGVGNIIVCFADESDAYNFANKYLVSKVQKTSNGFVFDEIEYSSEKKMLENLHKLAREMVSKHYFDASNPETYLTIKENSIAPSISEDSSQEEIDDYNNFKTIENLNLAKDIVVFSDENQANRMSAGEPYLNDRAYAYLDENGKIELGKYSIKFLSIRDYESATITLFHEGTDLVFEMPYGVSVQEFLDSNFAPSGRYKIVEKNYAGTTEFSAIYLAPGDMLSSITLERTLNGITTEHKLNKLDNHTRIRANNVVITNAQNSLDPYGIIKVKRVGGETTIYHMAEYAEIPVIDEEGNYEIILVDRIGRSIEFYVDIYSPNKVYSFRLVDGTTQIMLKRAYGGKKFELPTLQPQDPKFVFGGWQDDEGHIFFDEYIFESPNDITLYAVWNYANVSISIYDGKLLDSFNSHVGDLKVLPDVSKNGYDLFGYAFVQADGSIRFYRGQINQVPNVEEMRLDAVWTRKSDIKDVPQGSDNKTAITLINGQVRKTYETSEETLNLPELRTDGLEFVGWLYQHGLVGSIFKSQLNLNEIAEICGEKQNTVKLTAVWKTADENGGAQMSGTTSASSNGNSNGSKNLAQMSSKTKTSIISGVTSFVVLLMSILFGVWFAKRKNKSKQIPEIENQIETSDINVENVQKPVTFKRHHENAYKFKTFDFKKTFARIIFPCLVVFMAFTMLFISQQGLMLSVRGLVDKKEYEQAIQTEITRQLDLEDEEDKQNQDLLHDTFVKVQDAFSQDNSNLTSQTQSSTTEELSEEESFLYTLVMLDLMAMGYDVFPAKIAINNKDFNGFGYSDYEKIFEEESGKGLLYSAGFVSIKECNITQEDIENGIIIEPIVTDEDVKNKYLLTFAEEWGPVHYISFGNYVKYNIQDYAINYSSKIDTGDYDDSLGNVYNYDYGEITHYANYGEEFKYDAYNLTSEIDYTDTYKLLDEILSNQDFNSLMVNIENSSFISYQALNDYMAGNQNEALLGVDADLLLQYEAHINDNYYYIIMADGSVQVLELPPDPEEKASIWERIWMGLIAVTGVVLGVVVGSIPGIGPFLSGAIIGASIDLFMQVTISGVAVDNIDWVSVGASAVTGVLTAGISSATSAATKAALAGVKNVVAKFFIEAGIQLASGLFSGAISYITTAGIKGEPITMEGLVKALIVGGVTAVVMFCGGKILKVISNKVKNAMDKDVSQKQIERAVKKAQSGDCRDLNRLLNKKASQIARQVRNENPNWTKMRQGLEIHRKMKYTINTIKELDLKSFGRADGIDDIAGIIFELKPQTPKSMFAGLKQLERYEQGALRNEDLKKITKWIKILVTYETK